VTWALPALPRKGQQRYPFLLQAKKIQADGPVGHSFVSTIFLLLFFQQLMPLSFISRVPHAPKEIA
jgi:hypothetical protein